MAPQLDVERVADVVLIASRSTDDDDLLDRELPAGWANGPVRLLDDLTIERIEDSDKFMDACDPAGLDFTSTRQFGQRYSFVRQPAPTRPSVFHCDPDNRIGTALQLSRYVVLNSHCTEYAARHLVHYFSEEKLAPLRFEYRFHAYHALRDGARDWLTDADALVLGGLLRTFFRERDRFPKRVLRAMTRCEESFRTPFTETAAVGVVTALESLLKTERRNAGLQFKSRVPAMARELGLTGITKHRAERFYGLRSRSVHGAPTLVRAGGGANLEVRAFETVVTTALRRAIEDPSFRRAFKTKTTVAERWPA
ncbi:MAG TPA: hypothetical protein VKA61_02935 [Sphingomicrobium sp.]|nr:hypothetical protein [Sphingomicrobium sp.]